jgi:hypothetical protein
MDVGLDCRLNVNHGYYFFITGGFDGFGHGGTKTVRECNAAEAADPSTTLRSGRDDKFEVDYEGISG